MDSNMTRLRWFSKIFALWCLDKSSLSIGRVKITEISQGSTLRKNFISPAGLVSGLFTSPEIFLLALILMTTLFN